MQQPKSVCHFSGAVTHRMIAAMAAMNQPTVTHSNVSRANINVIIRIAYHRRSFVMAAISVAIIPMNEIVTDSFALTSNSNAAHRQIIRHFV